MKLSCLSLLCRHALEQPGSADRLPPSRDTKQLCPGREAGTQKAKASAMQLPAGTVELWNGVAGGGMRVPPVHLSQTSNLEHLEGENGYFRLTRKQL